MVDEVSSSLNTRSTAFNKSTGRGLAASIVSGKLLHRYRLIRRMGKAISMNRSLLSKSKGKLVYSKKSRLAEKQKELDKAITEFLERDDNSRMMPGKGDFTNCGVKVQKRYGLAHGVGYHARNLSSDIRKISFLTSDKFTL